MIYGVVNDSGTWVGCEVITGSGTWVGCGQSVFGWVIIDGVGVELY